MKTLWQNAKLLIMIQININTLGSQLLASLTLFHIQSLSDVSAAKYFWKYWDKRRNCGQWIRWDFTSHSSINPSRMFPGTSAADNVLKHCGKRKLCSVRAISPYSTVFSTLFDRYTFIYKGFPWFFSWRFQSRLLQICYIWEGV